MSAIDPILGPPVNPGSIVSFRQRGVQPPGALYVTTLDLVQVAAITSRANTTATFVYKLLLTSGEIQVRVETIVLGGITRAYNLLQFPLAEGFLLSVQVITAAPVTRGALYVSASLVRTSSATNFNILQPLFQGYVAPNINVGWPAGGFESPLSGIGNSFNTNLGNPAAGADFTTFVPTNAVWELKSLTYQLVTSAAAANRQSRINMDAGNNTLIFFQTDAQGNQVASTTNNYCFAQGLTRAALVNDTWEHPLPSGLRMRGGFHLNSLTAGLQAGDQYQNINFVVEEWLSL